MKPRARKPVYVERDKAMEVIADRAIVHAAILKYFALVGPVPVVETEHCWVSWYEHRVILKGPDENEIVSYFFEVYPDGTVRFEREPDALDAPVR